VTDHASSRASPTATVVSTHGIEQAKLSVDSGEQCLDWKDGSTDIAQAYEVRNYTPCSTFLNSPSFTTSAFLEIRTSYGSRPTTGNSHQCAWPLWKCRIG
jgi:hypothetical protein